MARPQLLTWCDRTIDLLLVASCGCSRTRRGGRFVVLRTEEG